MPKHIFVTGGVVSSLGKGIASASIAKILEAKVILVCPGGIGRLGSGSSQQGRSGACDAGCTVSCEVSCGVSCAVPRRQASAPGSTTGSGRSGRP